MSLDQAISFTILAMALVLFAWGKWRYDIVAALALLGWQRKQEGHVSFPATQQPLYVRPPHLTPPKHRRV